MDFKSSGRHVEVTPAIREYAEKRTGKLPRYYDLVQQINVVIDQRDRHFEVELIVDVEHAEAFVARASGEDLYACIDEAVDKAERQLTDHKEKCRNRKHKAS